MQLFAEKSSVVHVKGLDLDVEKLRDTFVIGAGFGRTGTSSMQIALAKLGWRSYHMREFFKNGKKAYASCIKLGNLKCDFQEFVEDNDPAFGNFDQIVLPKDAFDWNELFNDQDAGKYNATVDFPLNCFYLDLMEFYNPNYKVVLTVRDNAEQWYNSVDKTIRKLENLNSSFALRFMSWISGVEALKMRAVSYGHFIFDQPRDDPYMDCWADKQKCMKKYEDWIEGVKKHVPEDKLLIFNVKEGWKPLCEFLGVDAPDEPFPRSNETANMLKDVEECKKLIFRFNLGVAASVVVGVAAAGYYGYKKYFGGK